jgi:hypothetical protein
MRVASVAEQTQRAAIGIGLGFSALKCRCIPGHTDPVSHGQDTFIVVGRLCGAREAYDVVMCRRVSLRYATPEPAHLHVWPMLACRVQGQVLGLQEECRGLQAAVNDAQLQLAKEQAHRMELEEVLRSVVSQASVTNRLGQKKLMGKSYNRKTTSHTVLSMLHEG